MFYPHSLQPAVVYQQYQHPKYMSKSANDWFSNDLFGLHHLLLLVYGTASLYGTDIDKS